MQDLKIVLKYLLKKNFQLELEDISRREEKFNHILNERAIAYNWTLSDLDASLHKSFIKYEKCREDLHKEYDKMFKLTQ